jgi:hypothetical protein
MQEYEKKKIKNKDKERGIRRDQMKSTDNYASCKCTGALAVFCNCHANGRSILNIKCIYFLYKIDSGHDLATYVREIRRNVRRS